MRIVVSAATHRGSVREQNEDALGWGGWSLQGPAPTPVRLELEVTEPITIVTCDGMGGHAGGAQASRVACELLTAPFGSGESSDIAGLTQRLQRASDLINDIGDEQPELHGMGCTVAGLTVRPEGSATVFNVGDSRAYRVEGRYLGQLSVDHRRPGTNRLQQAIGGGRRMILEPDFFECPLPAWPGILLCTDGLDDYADNAAVEQAVVSAGDDLAVRLRELALAGGGGDNVTVVLVAAQAAESPGGAHG